MCVCLSDLCDGQTDEEEQEERSNHTTELVELFEQR